ncbi:retention module-containing protein [Pseudomonas sp. MH10]|uniref:retention module-containing protein n=2 Tax=Pseudomonas sp. MH10 TaxID=3048627 RepID=UPI002AC897F6|nr:retention module-containing protein [Pseudomonas sp. MH10]WPX64177.1 retention module-containing protein [Pseudomonas sp. MH10]
MAKLIGTITHVVGEVFAVAGDGARRALVAGDRVFAGEQLQTGPLGAVAVHLADGGELTLGRDSSMPLSPEILANHATHIDTPDTTAPNQAQLTDVQELQRAIAAGDDPTKVADPTAAGPTVNGVPGEQGGGHSFVLLTEVGGSVAPTVGFPTAGLSSSAIFPEGQVATLPDNGSGTPAVVVAPPDTSISIVGLDVSGGELTVNEANLPLGSASNPSALTQSASFTINAADGVKGLTIGGVSVITNGTATGFPQAIDTGLGNTLTVTGYNPVTGVVTYTYTLNGAETHSPGDGANNLIDHLPVVATNNDGNVATGSVDVNITDDVPTAINDSNPGTATENLITLAGNVLTNDIQGADRIPTGPIVAGTFVGTYGTLVLAVDGTYTYTLNPNNPDFVALHGGNGNGTETFTYTLKDADGDTSQANLVLQIHNNDNGVIITGLNGEGTDATVYEKNLATGSSPDATALTQNGTFTVTANDGVQSLSIGGLNVVVAGVASGVGQSLTTGLGNTLTITGYNAGTGVVSYSYTLNGADTHPTGNGANSLTEHFAVVSTDTGGSVGNASLNVSVVDDVPTAINDSNPGTATENLITLAGNVLTNDIQGADRIPTGPIVAGTFVGTYGTLVLAVDGTYTYTLNPNNPDFVALHGGNGNGTETFTYTLKDADGDTSQANLVLQIHNNDNGVIITGLNGEGTDATVYEKNLATGSSPDATALTQNGTFTVTANDGVQSLSIGGLNVVVAGVASGVGQSLTTGLGNTLTITGYNAGTGVVSYSYTLNGADTHPTGNGANSLTEHFAVVSTDTGGSVGNASLNVSVVDDVPTAINDSNPGTATENLITLAGNVLTNDIQGADRIPTGPIVAGTFVGTYGTLVLAVDGTYTYTLNPNNPDFVALHGGNSNGTETFTYTLKDADGDTSQANLVLQIHNNDNGVIITGLNGEGPDDTVYEKNLATGSSPDATALTQNGTFTVTANDGVQSLSIGGLNVVVAGVASGVGQSLTTGLGNTLTITGYNAGTGVVSYSYTLNGADTHPTGNGANSLTEHFNVVATNNDGDTSNASLNVNVIDDVPTAHGDSNPYSATETNPVLMGNVLINDVQGADRIASGPIVGGTFAGTYGTLVLETDGSYTYTLNPHDADFIALHGGANGTEVFTYTLKDADGDTSQANLVLTIHNNGQPVTVDGLNVCGGELTVYEKNLSNGSSPNAAALTQHGEFVVHAPDGLQSLNVGGINVVSGGVVQGFPGSVSTVIGSLLTVTGYNAQTGVVSYSYTLQHNALQADDNGANSISEHFTVVATDSDGSSASGVIDVNVVDDVPTAHADTVGVVEGGTVSGNVLINDVMGADGPGAGGPVVGVRAGGDTSQAAYGGLGASIVGVYGTLVLDASGNATYHSNQDSVGHSGAHDVFTYSIRDADGDVSTTTLTINVSDSCLKAVSAQGVTVFENALDLTQSGHDLAPGTVIGSTPDSPAETASGTLVGAVSGAVGAVSFSLVGSADGTLVGQYGEIHLNGDGTYTYTLTSAPKTSPVANDGANVEHEIFTYQATDASGNSVSNSLVINIVDDVPTAVSSERTSTVVGVDSNVLLIIDVSSSMADASGVSGLSRLDLEKQAISTLLDKYQDLGDVKVQIVTFSDSAADKTPVWVDVSAAKAIIGTLTAGGETNYDAAVAAAKQAFPTDGAIAGAQNVAYFLSDGNPTIGENLSPSDEAAWKAFLNSNEIKAYAIGLGSGITNTYLDPLAYDGSTHTDTNAVLVTDLSALNSVLSGTVQSTPITGSLMTGGTFGADGGFIKAIVVDGTSYLYDPKANNGQGGLSVSGTSHGTFDSSTHSATVASNDGGTLVVDMDNGQYTYTPPKIGSTAVTETFGFVASDNDGDTAGANLVVHVNPSAAPVAVAVADVAVALADNVITNILSPTLTVAAQLLLANNTDSNGDKLTTTSTTFTTGWAAKGADFTATNANAINFASTSNSSANQLKTVERSDFFNSASALTALVVLNGYLGATNAEAANAQDTYTVTLHKGETVTLNNSQDDSHVSTQWQDGNDVLSTIADGHSFTATDDGVYHLHVTNIVNTSGATSATGDENYQLQLTVNYAGAQDVTADSHGSYTVTDSHGGTSVADVALHYQAGDTVQGTNHNDILIGGPGDVHLHGGDGDDVLQAGSGNNELFGDNGNDVLISGPGNDLLDGGAGNNTASYVNATAGVHVDLSITTAQNTLGAGTDTLVNIQNLIGSHFNDTLIGDGGDNIINGGLGNNTLTGGGGNDTFKWDQGNVGHDLVTDFSIGVDKLDLSQLLQGDNSSSASLDDYLHFKVTGAGASVVTTIEVNPIVGQAPTQTIDLAGVDLANHYGVTPGSGGMVASGHDTASIITGMISDHSLKVDTV